MIHTCGQSHLKLEIDRGHLSNSLFVNTQDNNSFGIQTITSSNIDVYTAYLGKVSINVHKSDNHNISLETYHKVNNKNLLVKVVDAVENNLNSKYSYPLQYLKSRQPKKINLEKNKYYYVLTLLCRQKIAFLSNDTETLKIFTQKVEEFKKDAELMSKISTEYSQLTTDNITKSLSDYKKLYQEIVKYNSPIDIFFNTCHYLTFLYKKTGLVSVNKLDCLLSVSGVPELDNAFFTGQYMMYGNGDKMFYPLCSIDVIGHELSHGLVSGTAGLEYKGHSGAMNEGYADIMGTMFEFYMYEHFPNLGGEKDWLIGEDLGMGMPFLRNMKSPNEGRQPDKYKGRYYLDPNSDVDYGGVHINSGIINYCFYVASQNKNKEQVLDSFVKCLKGLSKNSNFMNFRDKLKEVSNNDPVILSALNNVGLTNNAITDYGEQPKKSEDKQPPKPDTNTKPPKDVCKHCPHHCPSDKDKTNKIPPNRRPPNRRRRFPRRNRRVNPY